MAKILIAEDDGAMRQFLAGALERAGHEVEAAEDGLAAKALVDANLAAPFDLLLADIIMPGMDGIELAHQAQAAMPAMKVMFITGFAAVAQARQTENPAPVLSKPFHLKDLVDQVQALLKAPAVAEKQSEAP